jgi:hypothetical protein
MTKIWLPPDPTRTNVSLDVAGEALPVRLVSDPPDEPTPPSRRLRYAIVYVWNDLPTRVILMVMLIGLGIGLGVANHFNHIESTPIKFKAGNLGHTVEYPPYLAVHENEQVSVTLVNTSTTISLTHVSVALIITAPLSINADTTVAQFDDLAPGERKTRTLQFTLNHPVTQPITNPINVALLASTDQFTQTLDEYPLNIVHLPWINLPRLKTFERWLSTALSGGLASILLWMLRGAFKFPEG